MKTRNPHFIRSLASACYGVIAALGFTIPASADLLPPVQDSSSVRGILTPATGKAPTLVVNAARKSYVRFDLSSLPDDVTAADITHARLRVYFPKVTKPGVISIVPITADWLETGTQAEPPVQPNAINTIPAAAMIGKRFAEIDITTAVQAWAGGATNYGVALVSDGTANVQLGAKEGPATGYPMELEIEIDRTHGAVAFGEADNVFIGAGAGAGTTNGASNTGIGINALGVNDGASNTAIGWGTLPANTTGTGNTALGYGALADNTTGSHNIAIGDEAGSGLTTGDHNIDIGAAGAAGETGTIRLGTEGVQTTTLLVGHVGIGTETPAQAKLVVSGTGDAHNTSAYGFLTNAVLAPAGFVAGTNNVSDVSIYATNAIEGTTFRAFSDARIKNIRGRSDAAADLQTLLGIQVTDYTYKDIVTKGSGAQKKLIAQQVEQIYPQAVSRTTDVVPDIFRRGNISADGWIELATDLKAGDRVRILGEKSEGIHEVLEVQPGRFRTAFRTEGAGVFVYGREVKDFRVVDYEAVAMLNVSATQELHRELQLRETELAAVKKELADLKAEHAAQLATLKEEILAQVTADLRKQGAASTAQKQEASESSPNRPVHAALSTR